MPDCSELTHIYGFNNQGNWVEQYRFDDLVLFENYPPVGQHSITPIEQVGAEKGWCTIKQEIPVEPKPPVLVDLPEEDLPQAGMGTLFLIVLAAEVGWTMYRRHTRKQAKANDEVRFLDPWPDLDTSPDEDDPYEMVEVHPACQTPVSEGNPDTEWNTALSRPFARGKHAPLHGPFSVNGNDGYEPARAEHVQDTCDTGDLHVQEKTDTKNGSKWPNSSITIGGQTFSEHSQITDEYAPQLDSSIVKMLPFDSLFEEQMFEFECFKELRRIEPDMSVENVILIMWRVRKSSTSIRYQKARERYGEFSDKNA